MIVDSAKYLNNDAIDNMFLRLCESLDDAMFGYLARDANINLKKDGKNPPLIMLLQKIGKQEQTYEKTIKKFLSYRPEVNIENDDGQTPLFFSHLNTALLLLDVGADINHKDNNGITPLAPLLALIEEELNNNHSIKAYHRLIKLLLKHTTEENLVSTLISLKDECPQIVNYIDAHMNIF